MRVSVVIKVAAAPSEDPGIFSVQMHTRRQRDHVLDSHADDCDRQIERKVRVAPYLEQECFAI
jgi:hypothetical protein